MEHVRVRSLKLVIETPVDCERPRISAGRRRNCTRKRCGRRPNHLLAAKASVRRGKGREIQKAWSAAYILRTCRIYELSGQTEGTVLVEAVHDSLAEVIVVESISAPDRAFSRAAEQSMQNAAAGMRRVCKGKAWSEVFVVPGPIWLLSVGLPGERHRDRHL